MMLLAKGAELFKNKSFIEACDALTQGTVCWIKIFTYTQVRCFLELHPSTYGL
jgi:hypothetical protein